MNGVFNETESRHLSADERLHYIDLGLCAPVGREVLRDLLAAEKARGDHLQEQLDESNETAVSLQETIGEQDAELIRLRRRITDLERVLEQQTVKTT